MGFDGTAAAGSQWVLVNGTDAMRRGDLMSHGGMIGEGEPTVVIGSLAAARKFDRFKCPDPNPTPHNGGAIADGSENVLIGGEQAARKGDATKCLGPGFDVSDLDAMVGAAGATDAATAAACKKLWEKYQDEAQAMIAPAGSDHRQRNHIINGAYASLYQSDRRFTWMGLGGYASKQVGCAMDQSLEVVRKGPTEPQRAIALYTYDQLGQDNMRLFLDVYPQYRFYQEQGWQRFKECAGERVPPVGGAMLDAFEAIERFNRTGDKRYLDDHLESVAYHEQVFILQRNVYNDPLMRPILDANEGNLKDAAPDFVPDEAIPTAPKVLVELGGGKPADVVMTSECTDTTAGQKKTVPFNRGAPNRQLHDMDDRMKWIMQDIGGYYGGLEGTQEHLDDMERLSQRGRAQGGNYP